MWPGRIDDAKARPWILSSLAPGAADKYSVSNLIARSAPAEHQRGGVPARYMSPIGFGDRGMGQKSRGDRANSASGGSRFEDRS